MRAGNNMFAPIAIHSANHLMPLGRPTSPALMIRCASTDKHNPDALDWFCAYSSQPHTGHFLRSSQRGVAYTVVLSAPFVVENLLPQAISVRWQCRETASVLNEAQLDIGERHAVDCTANHRVQLANPEDEPKLSYKRRGNIEKVARVTNVDWTGFGTVTLSILLRGFKWSEDAVVSKACSAQQNRGDKRSLYQKVAGDCQSVTEAIDLLQRSLDVRIAVKIEGVSVVLSLYCNVWLINVSDRAAVHALSNLLFCRSVPVCRCWWAMKSRWWPMIRWSTRKVHWCQC